MNENAIPDQLKQRAAAMIKTIPFPSLVGIEFVDLVYGRADLKLSMRDQLRQPYGFLHGGATATLIDTAMAFACISCLNEGEQTTTIDLTVHYLRPHTSGEVFCTAQVVRAGKRVITVSAEVANAEGKLIATALSTYSRS